MAMTAFEILGVLKLDKDAFDKGMKDAQSAAHSAGSALSTGAHALAGGIATAAKVGIAAVGAATTAAVGFGKSAVSAATEFESAFTGVKKTVDATEEEYATLSKWIMDASTKMASSQEEIAATMEIAGQLGISGVAGLEKFTETMIMLGDTTNLSAEEAAGALARFGNIAGVGAEDMDRIGSVIVDLGNNFATTEQDIVNMSTRLASAGTVAGLSATDILALSTAMSSVGIQAEAGGTAMAQTLAKMTKAVAGGGETLEQFAAVSGMSAEEFAATWKGKPIDAVTAFIGGLKNIKESDEEMVLVLEDLGLKGIRQTNMLQALALASDMLGNSVDMANTAFEENVALQNEANLRYSTTESQAQQTANAFKNLRIVVGEELKPMYGEMMSFAQETIKAMQTGFEEGGLEGLAASLGTGLSNALTKLNEYLPQAINMGVTLVSALGQGIMENLPTIIDAGIQILGTFGQAFVDGLPKVIDAGLQILEALLSAFDKNFDAIMDAVMKLIDGISKAIEKHKGGLRDAAKSILEKLTGFLIENIDDIAKFVTDMLLSFVRWVTDNAGTIIEAAVTIITTLSQGLIDALPELLPAIVDMIIAIVEGLIDNVDKLIDAALQIILALADGIIVSLPKLLEKAPEIVEKLTQQIVENAPKIIESAVELIAKLVEGIIANLPTLVASSKDIVDALGSGIIALGLSIFQIGTDIMDKIKEGIDSIPVADWAKDMIKGFVDGMTGGQAMGWLRDGATTVANKIKDFLGFSEPDEGPLSNFHTFAPDMMKLYSEGITDNLDLVEDAVRDTASAIESGFEITAAPNYSIGIAESGVEARMTAILEMLEMYLPTYATADDMSDMTVSVDGRQFGRLVREVG